MRIFVVMPAYNESLHIADVIRVVPGEVDGIIVVDDASTDNTSEVAQSVGDLRVIVIRHDKNFGVGGATISGYKRAMALGADIIVKIDADGQMDPALISRLVKPVTDGFADYTKGFRFHDPNTLRQMPRVRLFGNVALSFLVKLASGYWNIFDPTNGYTAIHRCALEKINLQEISNDYYFETDMLVNLYKINGVVSDVFLPTRYGDEESQLSPLKIAFKFPGKLFRSLFRRIIWRYFLIDFSVCSLFLVVGLFLFFFGVMYGSIVWIEGAIRQVPATTGTIVLGMVPLLLGFQLLLQALVLDIGNVPSVSIQSRDYVSNSYNSTCSGHKL